MIIIQISALKYTVLLHQQYRYPELLTKKLGDLDDDDNSTCITLEPWLSLGKSGLTFGLLEQKMFSSKTFVITGLDLSSKITSTN